MGKITNIMVEQAYIIGKQIFENRLSRLEGVAILENLGMEQSSAHDYIYNYSNLIRGKLFTRTTNVYATQYYLQKILEENGINGLKTALLSLSQHFDYYEDLTKRPIKKRREIYNEFYELVKDAETASLDELDQNFEYSEGKVKKILVNSYERNPVARQICINEFGLKCHVCEFDFQIEFGEIGRGFIHVHHKVDISTVGSEYSVNPIEDLVPVCANCHAMLHKRRPAFSIEELKAIKLAINSN